MADAKAGFIFKDFVDADGKVVIARTSTYRYICCVCDRKFMTKVLCIKHLESEHNVQVQEKYKKSTHDKKCTFCKKHFTLRKNMIRHVRLHHGGEQIPTRYEILENLRDVKQELSSESPGIKKESCPICGKSYARISGVNRHLKRRHFIDDESGTVCCHFCEMKFRDEESCSTHMSNFHHAAIVTENGSETDKPALRCTLCQEQFIERFDLREHLSSEHGTELYDHCVEITSPNEGCESKAESFNCDQCHLSSVPEDEWRSHMKGVHKSFPELCCQKCGNYSCNTMEELKCHLKDIHLEENKAEASNRVSREVRQEGARIGLTASELRVLAKIPDWLVKHGEGTLLVAVYK